MQVSNSSIKEFPSVSDGPIFRIGAAIEETGQTWPDVTNASDVHFVFPGVDFMLEEHSESQSLQTSSNGSPKSPGSDDPRRTGSSVATVLAAGLAGFLIHCTKLGAYHTIIVGGKVDTGNSINPKVY